MSDETKTCLSDSDLLKNSLLYKQFQAEREEILKHKCIESKKAGHDIGFEQAMIDWIIKHGSLWRKAHMMAARSEV
jgi:hypothetical protein